MKRLKSPEPNIRYSFRMPNGTWHSFAFYGTDENGRLLFINTTYGTKTSMTPARFSFMYKNYMKKEFPYIIENNYPTATAQKQAEEYAKNERQHVEDEKRRESERKKVLQAAHILKTLPIDVEYAVNRELNVNVYEIAKRIEGDQMDMYIADCYLKIERLLYKTPYALPSIK